MSQKVVYTCDRCKTAVTLPCAKVRMEVLQMIDAGEFGARRGYAAKADKDLCSECLRALEEFMNGT